jgi:hypothetical protein
MKAYDECFSEKKTFKEKWEYFKDGEFNLIDTEHFSFAIDRDFLALEIGFSCKFRMFHIQILCFVIDIY